MGKKEQEKPDQPAAEEPMPDQEQTIKRERYSAMARYVFTDNESRDMAREMARTVNMLASLEDEKKVIASDYTARINKAQAEVNDLARKLNNGYEFRMIEHERVYYYGGKIVRVYRLDTEEIVDERGMSDSEAQMMLQFQEEATTEIHVGTSEDDETFTEETGEQESPEPAAESETDTEDQAQAERREHTEAAPFPTEYEEEGGEYNGTP
jgi:hypothetical protein